MYKVIKLQTVRDKRRRARRRLDDEYENVVRLECAPVFHYTTDGLQCVLPVILTISGKEEPTGPKHVFLFVCLFL